MEIGIKGYAETMVDRSNVTSSIGSGLLEVFSTPSMIALMEKAAKDSIVPFLEEGRGSVGIRLEVDHLAATPVGQKVWAESELTEIDGRVLTFRVDVYSEKERSGRAFTNAASSTTSVSWQKCGLNMKDSKRRLFVSGESS